MSSWKSRQAHWCFCGDQSIVSVLTCGLASFHFTCYSSRRKHAQWARSLAPGSACVSEMYYRPSRNIASYSICLDVKCSNSSNHRRLVSVPVPHIRDISLLCYRFQSEWITETAKRSNVVNYVDSILSRPGLLKPNRDILVSRRQRSGFRDRVSKTRTVPEKPGRLVSLFKILSM